MIQSYKKPHQLEEQYDAVIIGTGMGSLTSAAFLAKEGKKVLLLERHYTAGGFTHVFKRKGYEWDVGIHYIGEVQKENSALRKMFDYISNGNLLWADMGEVYVYGELTDWQLKDRFKMEYFPDYGMYGCSVLLKQSYYNYHFVIKDKDGNIDYTFTEGNHQETENDYIILIYHKNVFYGYDELIGMGLQNSSNLKD